MLRPQQYLHVISYLILQTQTLDGSIHTKYIYTHHRYLLFTTIIYTLVTMD